jgi:hypothetical protein
MQPTSQRPEAPSLRDDRRPRSRQGRHGGEVDYFSHAVRNADVAIFYYSGHAMQFGGFNYLMPVDAALHGFQSMPRCMVYCSCGSVPRREIPMKNCASSWWPRPPLFLQSHRGADPRSGIPDPRQGRGLDGSSEGESTRSPRQHRGPDHLPPWLARGRGGLDEPDFVGLAQSEIVFSATTCRRVGEIIVQASNIAERFAADGMRISIRSLLAAATI